MNAQFKKGVLEMCVLSLLSKKDMYGYELTEQIGKEMEVTTGTLYIILKRLTDEGYFTTYLKESSDGPARKYYTLTEKGHHKQEELKKNWHQFVVSVNRLMEEVL